MICSPAPSSKQRYPSGRSPIGRAKFTYSPGYYVLLVVGLALLAIGWIGERQDWSATVTFVLFIAGAAALAGGTLFRHRVDS